jgi:hypothetical protein
VPAFVVRKGYRSCAVVRRGFAATAQDDQPTLIVGPHLAEIDFGTEEFAGVEPVIRATAIAAADVAWAGTDDQACPVADRHVA